MPKGFQKGHKGFWKGKSLLKEHKRKLSIALKGRKFTEEHKKKIGLAHLGNKYALGNKWNIGRKHTKETRKKLSEYHRKNPIQYWLGKINPWLQKEKHWNWRGGKSFEPYSLEWTKELKTKIRKRDFFTCAICKKKGFSVHHINYNKKDCSPKNLITLCRGCNSLVNFDRDYWINYFSKK